MIVNLYATSDRRDKIYKSLSTVGDIDIKLKSSTNFMSPVFTVSSINMAALTSSNYCYIPDFKRYYFINDWVSINKDIIEVHCDVDVLYTYRDAIGDCEGIMERSQGNGEPYINDDMLLEKASKNIRTVVFSNPDASAYTNVSLILVTANTN